MRDQLFENLKIHFFIINLYYYSQLIEITTSIEITQSIINHFIIYCYLVILILFEVKEYNLL